MHYPARKPTDTAGRLTFGTLVRYLTLISLCCALALTGGCYLYPKEEEPLAPPLIEPKEISYSTLEVTLGSIEQVIQLSGTFRAETYYECMFKRRGGYVSLKNVRVGQIVKKGDVLIELDVGELRNDIRRREIAVERAKMEMVVARKTRDKDTIQVAQWNLELAELDLADGNATLSAATLIAPSDGRVSFVDKINAGDYADAYKTVVRIDNTEDLVLELDGDKAGEFELGRAVVVSFNRDEYAGEVVMTPRTAPDTMSDEQRNHTRITVDGLTGAKLGDSARVTMVLKRNEEVVVLPKNLLRNFLGRKYVQVLVDGLPMERDVEVGMETNSQVEIIAGLEVGDMVIDR